MAPLQSSTNLPVINVAVLMVRKDYGSFRFKKVCDRENEYICRAIKEMRYYKNNKNLTLI